MSHLDGRTKRTRQKLMPSMFLDFFIHCRRTIHWLTAKMMERVMSTAYQLWLVPTHRESWAHRFDVMFAYGRGLEQPRRTTRGCVISVAYRNRVCHITRPVRGIRRCCQARRRDARFSATMKAHSSAPQRRTSINLVYRIQYIATYNASLIAQMTNRNHRRLKILSLPGSFCTNTLL